MDVARPGARARKNLRRFTFVCLVIAAIAATAIAYRLLSNAPAALPTVSRDGLIVDRVVFATLARETRGPGTIVSATIHVVSSAAGGSVAAVDVIPGSHVVASTIVAHLANPEVDSAVMQAREQLVAAQTEIASVVAASESAAIDQRAAYENTASERRQAAIEEHADAGLHAHGLIGDLPWRLVLAKNDALASSVRIAEARIASDAAQSRANLAVARAKVGDAQGTLASKLATQNALAIRAGAAGVVQSVAAQSGADIAPGAEIARIANQYDLKAVLQIPEADVAGVALGQPVRLDLHGALGRGEVSHVDPASINGSVGVDVHIDTPDPQGLRPDASVEGTIVLERLPRALTIERPAASSDDSAIDLFELSRDGGTLRRVRVRLGRGSTERVDVVGLAPGDRVVVSDMSAYAGIDRLQIR